MPSMEKDEIEAAVLHAVEVSLEAQLKAVRGLRSAFPGDRSQKRAIQHAIALPCVFGRRTISRTLGALGRWDQDWSADYKMFSRCRWKPERLFDPVIDEYLERYPKRPVIAA